MSDLFTSIRLPNSRYGFNDRGRKTTKEMIANARVRAKREKEMAELVLNSPDEAFQIDIVRGLYVRHHIETLQEAKK
jgi:hypothetical protein